MKPDVLCAWPVHTDFPMFRHQLRQQRYYFHKVIISFTKMQAEGDYRDFIRNAMSQDRITFVDNEPAQAKEDWRDKATNNALNCSDSEWVLFTEEDFFIFYPEEFWKMISDLILPPVEFVGYLQDVRIHPCFMLVKREAINKTTKDFGVVPDSLDHFGKFTNELKDVPKAFITETDTKFQESFHHMNGLSQNMYLLQTGQEPNYRPEEFKGYLKACLKLDIPLHSSFVEMVGKYLKVGDVS